MAEGEVGRVPWMRRLDLRVFLYGFGYFACYLPYAAITKGLTSSSMSGAEVSTGLSLLPLGTLASALGMAVFLLASGLYRHTIPAGRRFPVLRAGAVFSGLATAVVLVSTTLSYTFASSSVPFVMVLMRGGVLLLAPIIDWITGRVIPWYAWVALTLSGAAIALVTLGEGGGGEVSLGLGVVLASYLGAYVVRLLAMSRMAKTQDVKAGYRFFAEEQMVATPAALMLLALVALFSDGTVGDELRRGFLLDLPHPFFTVVLGLLSQGTGIFGALVLLDARGNASSVPINRAASIVAGLGAGVVLALIFGVPLPTLREWIACGLLVLAVWLLYWFSRPSPKEPSS